MAQAASEIIPAGMLAGRGIAVTNYENVTGIDNVDVIGASHPLPDAAGLNARRSLPSECVMLNRMNWCWYW